MNKLFISQNTTRNITKENNAKLYYYGPDHLNGNSKSTTRVLFGVSFDYGLSYNEDTEEYFSISFTFNYITNTNEHLSKQVSYKVNIQDVLDYGINDKNYTDFIFPFDLAQDAYNVKDIEGISNIDFEVSNPSSEYIYNAPTGLSINSKYINVIQNIFIDGEYAGNYRGKATVTLEDSSAQESLCTAINKFDFYDSPYSDITTATFILKSRITESAAIPPHISIRNNTAAYDLKCNWDYTIIDYRMNYPNSSIETILTESGSNALSIPTNLTTSLSTSNYIEETTLGDYMVYTVNLTIESK